MRIRSWLGAFPSLSSCAYMLNLLLPNSGIIEVREGAIDEEQGQDEDEEEKKEEETHIAQTFNHIEGR